MNLDLKVLYTLLLFMLFRLTASCENLAFNLNRTYRPFATDKNQPDFLTQIFLSVENVIIQKNIYLFILFVSEHFSVVIAINKVTVAPKELSIKNGSYVDCKHLFLCQNIYP